MLFMIAELDIIGQRIERQSKPVKFGWDGACSVKQVKRVWIKLSCLR